MEKTRIQNLMILDASGSMQSIYKEALSGVNETIQTIREAQREHADEEHLVTFASFNSGSNYLRRLYEQAPIDAVRELTVEDYRPNCGTALYDAMGTMLSEMRLRVQTDDKVLVTIITDGYENSSVHYSGEMIKRLVEELREMGWTFTYIGANQDVEAEAARMGINNALKFEATEEDTLLMFQKEKAARQMWYEKVRRKEQDFDNNFWNQ